MENLNTIWKNSFFRNLFVFFIATLLLVLDSIYVRTNGSEIYIYSFIGIFAIAFSYLKNKITYGLLSSLSITMFVVALVIYDLTIINSLLLSITYTLVTFFLVFAYDKLIKLDHKYYQFNLKSTIIYIAIITLISLANTVFELLVFHSIFNIYSDLSFVTIFISTYLSFLIFGSILIKSFQYDRYSIVLQKRIAISIVFILLSSIMFFSVMYLSAGNQQFDILLFLLIIPFSVVPLYLGYNVILVLDIVYIYAFVQVYLPSVNPVDYSNSILGFHIYLFLLTTIALTGKTIYITYKDNYDFRIILQSRLNEIIQTHITLYEHNYHSIIDSHQKRVEYSLSLFDYLTTLFTKFDYACCTLQTSYFSEIVSDFKLNAKGIDLAKFNDVLTNITEAEMWSGSFLDLDQESLSFVNAIHKNDVAKNLVSNVLFFPIKFSNDFTLLFYFSLGNQSSTFYDKKDFKRLEEFKELIYDIFDSSILMEKNRDLENDILTSLIRTIELYDKYTGNHSESVAEISKWIATKLQLSKQEINDIYWAGILHDIGKLGVASEIINKNGKLNDTEFNIVKKHPVDGHDILMKTKRLSLIASIVKHHHERFDGTGYPEGISGNEIPLGSRIISVADAFDAITSDRSYRKAYSKEFALKEMKSCSGTQFDPEILQLFLEDYEEIIKK